MRQEELSDTLQSAGKSDEAILLFSALAASAATSCTAACACQCAACTAQASHASYWLARPALQFCSIQQQRRHSLAVTVALSDVVIFCFVITVVAHLFHVLRAISMESRSIVHNRHVLKIATFKMLRTLHLNNNDTEIPTVGFSPINSVKDTVIFLVI